jgi:hypothetical protein
MVLLDSRLQDRIQETQDKAVALLSEMQDVLSDVCPACYQRLQDEHLRDGDFWQEVTEYDNALTATDHSDCSA